jgi:hypothetical protein
MVQSEVEIERFRGTGASHAKIHAAGASPQYRPMPPTNMAFCVKGRCNITKYACYLYGYRQQMKALKVPLPPLPNISELFSRPDWWFSTRPSLQEQLKAA